MSIFLFLCVSFKYLVVDKNLRVTAVKPPPVACTLAKHINWGVSSFIMVPAFSRHKRLCLTLNSCKTVEKWPLYHHSCLHLTAVVVVIVLPLFWRCAPPLWCESVQTRPTWKRRRYMRRSGTSPLWSCGRVPAELTVKKKTSGSMLVSQKKRKKKWANLIN